MKKIILTIIFISFALVTTTVKAATASDILPCDQYNTSAFDACGDVNGQVTSLIKYGIAAVFGLIILYGIFLIIKAALTIIRSNGDAAQIEAGTNIIRGVYIGIGIIFIGIIGLIVVIAFFGATGILTPALNSPGGTVIPLITN